MFCKSVTLPVLVLLVSLAWSCGDGGGGNGGKPEKGKDPSQEVKKEAGDLFEALGEWAGKTKEEMVRTLEGQVETMEKKMADLKKEAASRGEEFKQRWNREIEPGLQKRLEQVREEMGRLREGAGDSWKQMKGRFEEVFDDLQKAYEAAEKELKK